MIGPQVTFERLKALIPDLLREHGPLKVEGIRDAIILSHQEVSRPEIAKTIWWLRDLGIVCVHPGEGVCLRDECETCAVARLVYRP